MRVNKKLKKKGLYLIVGIFGLLTVLHFGIDYLVKTTLPKIIEEKNDTPYTFTYEKVGFSIWKNAIWVSGIQIDPKDVNDPKTPVDFTAAIKEIGVQGVNFIRLLRKKEISAYSIYIKSPEVIYYKWAEKRERARHSKSLSETLHVGRFNITNGNFVMYESDHTTQQGKIEKLNIELRGVDLSEATISKKIPFRVESFQFKTGKVSFQVNPLQRLKSKSFKIDNNSFVIKGLQLKTHGEHPPDPLPYALLPEIDAPLITLTGMDFGYEDDGDNYFSAATLELDKVDVLLRQNLDRHLSKKDDKGHLIPFKLDIGQVVFTNSNVESFNSFQILNFDLVIDSLHNVEAESLNVKSISVIHPNIMVLHRQPREVTVSHKEHLANFNDHIRIGEFSVKKATFHQELEEDYSRDLKNINVEITGIEVTPDTYKRKIPLDFLTLNLDTDAFSFPLDKTNEVASDGIQFEDGKLSVKNFSITPFKGKERSAQAMTIKTSSVVISQVKWELENTPDKGFDADLLSIVSLSYNKDGNVFKAPTLELTRPSWRFSGPSGQGLKAGILNIPSFDAQLNNHKSSKTGPTKSKALIPVALDLNRLTLGKSNITVSQGPVIRNLQLEIDGFRNEPGKSIKAGLVKINHPEISIPQKPAGQKQSSKTKKASNLQEEILIGSLSLNKGSFRWVDKLKKKETVEDINLAMTGLYVSNKTLSQSIPAEFKTINLTTAPFTMDLDDVNRLSTGGIHYQNGNVAISAINISPLPGKEKAAGALVFAAPSLSLSNAHWSFDNPTHPGLNADALILPSVNLKMGEAAKTKSKKAAGLLPIGLNLATVHIGNTQLSLANGTKLSKGALNLNGVTNSAKEGLVIQNFTMEQPNIELVSGKKSGEKKKGNFTDKIKIGNFSVTNGGLVLNSSDGKSIIKVPKFSTGITDFLMDSNTSKQKIPFQFKNLNLSTGAFHYSPNAVYDLKLSALNIKNNTLSINNFGYVPKMTRAQFVTSLKVEKDLYDVTIDNIKMNGLDFGFKGNDFYLKSDNIAINKLDADIFRSKIPPDDKTVKKMYNELLRDLKFYLDVNTIDIKNSVLNYEEQVLKGTGTGKLTFSNFNANIKNVHSGFKKTTLPDVVVNINTNFMGPSQLYANWTFNPMNLNDEFNINGNMTNFEASNLTPFLEPNLHATTTGNIELVEFNFNGNNTNGNGVFGLKYDKLHVTLINPRTGKPKKFISKMGNLFIKAKSRDKLKQVDVKTVVRNQDKSFFNFLWLLVMQGLKQTVLLI